LQLINIIIIVVVVAVVVVVVVTRFDAFLSILSSLFELLGGDPKGPFLGLLVLKICLLN